jgi:hypothetical protein
MKTCPYRCCHSELLASETGLASVFGLVDVGPVPRTATPEDIRALAEDDQPKSAVVSRGGGVGVLATPEPCVSLAADA